jgi:predicted RND superfamily exporter protein
MTVAMNAAESWRPPSDVERAPARPPRQDGPRLAVLRAVPWFACSIVTLVLMAATGPFIARAAIGVLGVDGTTPLEWVPPAFGPRQEYDAFTLLFESGDVVVVTWPGCELGSRALDALAAAASGADAPRDAAGRPWFDGVATGTAALEQLAGPPLDLDRAAAVERLKGLLLGPDGRTTCAVVGFTLAGIAERQKAVAWIRDLVSAHAAVAAADVRMAGPVTDNVAIDLESSRSLTTFALPAGLVVLAVTWWSLRSLLHSLLVCLVAAWCVGLSFANLAILGDRMNAVLIVMPVLVLVLGVAGGIHLVNYLEEAFATGGRQDVAARGVALGWLPCCLSAGTTAVGLASLTVSTLEPIRVFGFHGAAGVLAGLVAMVLVIPGIFQRWPISPRRSAAGGRWSQAAAALVVRRSPHLLALFGMAMAAAAVGIPQIRTSVRIDTLFEPESRVIADYAWIERSIGPLVPIEVVVRFTDGHDVRASERLDLIQAIEARLRERGHVTGVVSAATFLPPLPPAGSVRGATQRTIAARRLERDLAGTDTLKYVRDVPEGQVWRVTARVPALEDIDYGMLLDRVREDIAPLVVAAGGTERGIAATCTGAMPLVHSIQNTLLGDLFWSFLSACGVITVVMMLVERGAGAGLLAMVSNVFPMILLFGLLGWTRTPLDIGSVMTASIALGMAIDGTLHFLTFYRRARDGGATPTAAVQSAYSYCAAALVQTSAVCGLGILVFSASTFAPTSRFAVMLALLVAAALLGDLVLLPALLVSRLGRLCVPAAKPGGRVTPAEAGGA